MMEAEPEVVVARAADNPPDGAPTSSSAMPVVHIRPSTGRLTLGLPELWRYRDLLLFLAWRDVKVRYSQTLFGFAWAVLQPLFMMLVFSLFFGRFAKLPSDGVPYPVMTLCGIIPWQLFQYSLGQSANSVVSSQSLIKKVYFPRLVIPVAAVIDGLVDFFVSLVLLLLLMLAYGVVPTPKIILLPLFVLFAVLAALSIGVWLSALNVRYRDVRYIVPFLIQFWMFATPVAYSETIVPERLRWVYGINPMVGVVEGFRWAVIGHGAPLGGPLYVSIGVVALILGAGLLYFRRVESTFADVV